MAKYNVIGRNQEFLGSVEASDESKALNKAITQFGAAAHHVEEKAIEPKVEHEIKDFR